MQASLAGAIDCDLHPPLPGVTGLLPHLSAYWRDQITNRYIDKLPFQLSSYPATSPLSARPDWRPAPGQKAGPEPIRTHVLDRWGLGLAILNPLHGAVALFNNDMAAALCSAVNDWVAKELLDAEPRLRASILLPVHDVELSLREIERLAPDRRFVQALFLAMGEAPLGRRVNWPLFAACQKHGLAVGIHAGSTYRHAPTYAGWPSYRVEDYVAQSGAFETQLLSLIAEGVFQTYPKLKVVLMESGLTWLPHFLWRTGKTWRGTRPEVPWVDRAPAEIVRENVRFTLQPVDAPRGEPEVLARVMEHLGSDNLILFSTDYPHWQFDGEEVLPAGLGRTTIKKMLVENALDTYLRLREGAAGERALSEETVP
ncbi:MAG: amidohydrolase [Hyphomicrobiaceae bacterium]|nr:amidohydrolase [Hyphomicrobiaceae bacterium]